MNPFDRENKDSSVLQFSFRTLFAIWIVCCCCVVFVRISLLNVAPIAMIMLPSIFFLLGCHHMWKSEGIMTSFDSMVRLFCLGFFPGSILLFLVEILVTVCFALACFGTDLRGMFESMQGSGAMEGDPTADSIHAKSGIAIVWGLTSPIRGLVFVFLSSFVTAGLLEETLKLGIAVGKSKNAVVQDSRANTSFRVHKAFSVVSSILSFSLGFGACESLAFICIGGYSLRQRVSLALGRLVFALPMHVACGCSTGIGLVKRGVLRDRNYGSWSKVLGPAVVAHGLFDLQVLVLVGLQSAGQLSATQSLLCSVGLSSVIMVTSVAFVVVRLKDLRVEIVRYYSSGLSALNSGELPRFRYSQSKVRAAVRADGSVVSGLLSAGIQRIAKSSRNYGDELEEHESILVV